MLGKEQCKAFSLVNLVIQQNPYNKSQQKEVSSENSMFNCQDLATKRKLENVKHEIVKN